MLKAEKQEHGKQAEQLDVFCAHCAVIFLNSYKKDLSWTKNVSEL